MLLIVLFKGILLIQVHKSGVLWVTQGGVILIETAVDNRAKSIYTLLPFERNFRFWLEQLIFILTSRRTGLITQIVNVGNLE